MTDSLFSDVPNDSKEEPCATADTARTAPAFAASSSLFPFRRRLRENWAQAWFKGPVEFEIEWVPKARYFTFSLTFNFDKEERLG